MSTVVLRKDNSDTILAIQHLNDSNKKNDAKANEISSQLSQLIETQNTQRKLLNKLVHKNERCFRLFLLIAIVAIVVGSILLAHKLM